jgi:hypothetical protein
MTYTWQAPSRPDDSEFLSLRFIEMLDSPGARDAAMGLKLSKRITIIKKLLKETKWPNDEKKKALKLWAQADELRGLRNQVGHSFWTGKTINRNTPVS